MARLMETSSGPDAGAGRAVVRFHIGDVVRNGTHIATVTDVGTVLVAVTTTMGASRMVCPWELVRLVTPADMFDFGAPLQ
ncbi:hypothetical protein FZI85_08690 [Mycobacterium sp. CBMA293]|uniref:hypothetical protein n=1 Tax=unclassified Mycolicibacterium TaxID=2636767 RepID=UPI0012DCD074|nr:MULTISPECIES: hypothetical protein [unclassified Mycolicibacterium]MUL46327.1 hypothetical protein [Mycolicibacterium sp. CBMA 360]MUL57161.1 hypothetical protein [Mycolicibacterium sp. CBMA 335]MUL70201.1 hypothetical protein [Mycolicibacterium sp. CBMA 311]MUL92249.1 hypothetical protein [Mycolicibacterium sp. CBMA 230]MUM11105.1 hypothetical protein [Mycolicibacterium sp. CBMA 293]